MVVVLFEIGGGIGIWGRDAVYQDVVYRLKVERLFDLCVWRNTEMEEDQ